MAGNEAEDTLILETTKGQVTIAMRPDLAPGHVARIRELVREGFYDGVRFHRVIEGFMAQTGDVQFGKIEGGDMRRAGTGGSSRGDLPAEFSDVPFDRGTVGMARSQNPNSANSQFFINVGNNVRLDPNKNTVDGSWGYTVFGYVIEGMDVVDKIVSVQTGPQGSFQSDVPMIPIVIKKLSRYTFE